ncbi:hypothetical protein FXF51_00910 [Nonomuraea sp. PA05]|uniref:hypothetical protein n=1 Tax=Nonomuraea sp. PA05 TaxID=2604466 RepID=UPI0011D8E73E|nr:hypothetical protein [Nonomuraea sp. PA05]TYB71033.1 hypothetical protein FXF51_00910 [Nonomuraea sp. PA05]
MRRLITTLVTCGALLTSVASAQAVIKDPVQALKAVLGSGDGVRFTETTTLLGAGEPAERRRTGTFEGKIWWKDRHQSHLWHTELLGYDEQLVNRPSPRPWPP